MQKRPVVLDTDIGTDIDDTWALAMLLGCPELDVRLVTTATGDTTYRARVAAGILDAAGRADVPLGIGIPTPMMDGLPATPQGAFASEIDLAAHRGGVMADGVAALVECVMGSKDTVTVIAIAPLTNVAAALALEPRIAERARFVGMHGWIREARGFDGAIRPAAPEYNVYCDVAACRATFASKWEKLITPIDTCGSVVLKDDSFKAVRDADGPLMRALFRSYEEWAEVWPFTAELTAAFDRESQIPYWLRRSSVLYDTVAVYLAYEESLLNIDRLRITVDENGLTREGHGSEVRVATSWADKEAFERHLVERLLRADRP